MASKKDKIKALRIDMVNFIKGECMKSRNKREGKFLGKIDGRMIRRLQDDFGGKVFSSSFEPRTRKHRKMCYTWITLENYPYEDF